MVSTVVYYIFPVVLIFGLIRKYREITWSWCKNKESLEGKTVLITGANSGIGYETAKELASRKANIIFACRNVNKAEESIGKIKKSVLNCKDLVAVQLDLSSLKNIRQFAQNISKAYPEIHILINNAGVYAPLEQNLTTKDGFEIHFGVNHLGHFLLTNLLIDNLKRAAPSRVVIVSSLLHERGVIDLDNLNMEKNRDLFLKQSMNPGYCNSKLANAYFGRELANKLAGTNVDVYSVCPGFTHTGLFRDVAKWYHYIFFAPIAFLFMRTAKQGAQSVIYCATEPSIKGESGNFYRNCMIYKSKANFNPLIQKSFWDVSAKLVGLSSK